ncbi:MAG: 2OG-Fe(II) oxygenase [Ferruginibacter sp.]
MKLNRISNHIFIIESFWTKEACESFILKSEKVGYEAATVETEMGMKVLESVRNNNRVIYKDFELAETLWSQLKPFAPQQIGNSIPVGLNELFRFYKYQPGQLFKKHIDQSYIRNDLEASYYTFMIYLNDGYKGGETTFAETIIQPSQGTALVFLHSLEHEGSEVTEGTKYVLRTDIMYRLTGTSD